MTYEAMIGLNIKKVGGCIGRWCAGLSTELSRYRDRFRQKAPKALQKNAWTLGFQTEDFTKTQEQRADFSCQAPLNTNPTRDTFLKIVSRLSTRYSVDPKKRTAEEACQGKYPFLTLSPRVRRHLLAQVPPGEHPKPSEVRTMMRQI